MIQGHEILNLPDKSGKHKFTAEVNWEPENERTNNCKVIRLKCGHGEESYISRNDFLSFLWLIGKSEDHMKMVPQKLTTVRRYETVVGAIAQKNIQKGEMINMKVSIPLPAVEEEVIGDVKKYLLNKHK